MTTLLLVRHGRTAANASGLLAGWTPGVHLDDHGVQQATALGTRLLPVPVAAVVTSPLERCRETAAAIGAGRDGTPEHVDDRIGECHYGDWTGKALKDLTKDPMWRVVQAHPSAVRFPGPDGESMLDTQHRAVAAVRAWNETLGPRATYLICSHGDVIKGIIADCLGMHLDLSQRVQADPCSLTVIRYTPLRPFLLRMNDTGGGIEDLMPRAAREKDATKGTAAGLRDESDAVVGGGAGADPDNVPEEAQTGAPAVREPSADARG